MFQYGILFVSHSAGLGGAERELLKLLQFFARYRDQYRIYGAFPEGELAAVFRSLCDDSIAYQGALPALWRLSGYAGFACRSLIWLPSLVKFIAQKHIDLLFINTSVLLGPLMVGGIMHLPVITCVRELITPAAVRVPLFHIIDKYSTRAIVISQAILGEYMRIAGSSDKTRLIYGGTPVTPWEKVKPYWKREKQQALKIGVIGAISPVKGQLFFVEAAIRLLMRAHQPLQFYIVGPQVKKLEWYYEQLVQRCQQAGVLSHVIFTGEVADITAVYRSLDIVVVSSLSEGQSMVVLEAFDQARAVVATRSGGPSELIENGHNGLLVPPGDPEALADAIQRLIDDPDLRLALALHGRQTVEQQFNLEQSLQATKVLVDEVLMQRGANGAFGRCC